MKGRRPLRRAAALAFSILGLVASQAQAETYPRVSAAEGTVISHKTGEQAKFVDGNEWRAVDVEQDLLAGDTLRTNAAGNLSIRFADKTLVRMGRNTTLVVKKIDNVAQSVLGLEEGSVWARAVRGGSQLKIDTPAAAAAIRGTDWTLRVNGAQTTLTVMEGAVELTNAHGTVLVKQGEGATATLGQAPRKYTLVNLKEREQMLLYNEVRDAFSELPASNLTGPRSRAERRRLLAIAPEARSAEDWLTLAETSLMFTGRAETRKALAHLKRPLDGPREARARLVEALLAGQDTHYAEAARLFAAALPGLPRDRKAAAAYGLWFARSLAEPNRKIPPPSQAAYANDPVAIIARADAVAHLEGPAAAIDLLVKAEKRFPDDARLPAMRADFALQLDRRDEVKGALARAESLDPDEPSYLVTRAQFKSAVSSDLDGALADLQHAAAIAPGADNVWNEIGVVQTDRNAIVEADAAHKRAIALNPENAALHANYARFLMVNDQMAAAKREIDAAESYDAHSYAVLAAKGRYLLRIGKSAEGEKALLEASALNPTYGDALIGLAIASYQQDAGDETMQALDNADRFDRDNPSIPLIRAAIALDQFKADEAIADAREALRRRKLRGGYYSGYDANRQASSYLGVALKDLGLDEWGQYYADRGYDPFMATSYLDQDDKGRTTPFVSATPSGLDRFPSGASSISSQMQGVLLDPLLVASEVKRNSLERRSFFEAALGGSLLDQGAGPDIGGNILLQGTNYSGMPLSYYIRGETSHDNGPRENDSDGLDGLIAQVGLRPTLTDNIFLFANKYHTFTGFPGTIYDPALFDTEQTDNVQIGGAWSHTIAERNVVQMFAVSNQTSTRQKFVSDDGFFDQKNSDRVFTFGLGHMLGVGPVTLRYGVEAVQLHNRFSQLFIPFDPQPPVYQAVSSHDFATRSYLDAIYDVSKDLQFEAGAHFIHLDGATRRWGSVDPKLGVAWSPTEGQWLRAYYRQDTQLQSNYTLSPIATVGLMPMELPLFMGGQTRTAGFRWDAEWSDRFFTSVEYQNLRFSGLSLSYDDLLTDFFTTDGKINRLNFSANYWIGHGLGAFGSLTLYDSHDLTPGWTGFTVPLVPDYTAQIGLKYVNPHRVTMAVAQNFVGKRIDGQGENGNGVLGAFINKPYTTTDAALTWSSENNAVDWGLSVTNIFDHRTESAVGMPNPGRTFKATFTVRY